MKFLIITILALFTISNASPPTPQGCTAVSNTYFVQNKYSMSISASFSIDDIDPNYLIVSNISVNYGSPNFFKTFCVVSNNDQIQCLTDLNKSIRFPIQNSTETSLFYISVNVNNTVTFKESYTYDVFPIVFDEGSFSLDSGEIFSSDDFHSCYGDTVYDRHGKLQYKLNQCCEMYKPVHANSQNVTKCHKFKSRTTIYNVDDNYSIFATTQVNYTLTEKNMTFHGESMGPEELKIWIGINSYDSCIVSQNANGTCKFSIPSVDSKFLLNTVYENSTIPYDYNDIFQDHKALIGRLIFRNGIAMMAESDPFTPENNCQYYNLDFSPNQVISSSFCCSEF